MSLTTMYPSIREASAKHGVCQRFPAAPRYGANLTQVAEVTVAVRALQLIVRTAVRVADCHGTYPLFMAEPSRPLRVQHMYRSGFRVL